MQHILIASVGTREIQSEIGGEWQPLTHARKDGLGLLRDIWNAFGVRPSEDPRASNAELRAITRPSELAHLIAGYIDVPLLRPTLEYLHDAAIRPNQIYLIATDQVSLKDDPKYREEYAKDTINLAHLIELYLWARPELAGSNVEPAIYSGNPADYGETIVWARDTLQGFRVAQPEAKWHIAAVGGTPALTASLIIAGTEVFADKAAILYKDSAETKTRELDIARELRAESFRQALLTDIEAFAFDAALRMCDANKPLVEHLITDAGNRDALRRLLENGMHRVNAHLDAARKRLPKNLSSLRSSRDEPFATNDEKRAVALALPDSQKEEAELRLQELIASARLVFGQQRYYDFVMRVDTFTEMMREYLVLCEYGVYFTRVPTGDDREKMTIKAWREQHPDQWPRDTTLDVHDWRKTNTRGDLYAKILNKFRGDDQQKAKTQAYSCWDKRTTEIRDTRNDAAHAYGGLTRERLETAWGSDPKTIVPAMARLAEDFGIADVDEASDPYLALRDILRKMLGAEPWRS